MDVADILGTTVAPEPAPTVIEEHQPPGPTEEIASEPDPTNTGSTEAIVIHFLEDGFTALGNVWYRGQELEFAPGCQAYRDTLDRNGRTWLDLRGDEMAQIDRWGKVMFRVGPWPGKPLTAVAEANFEPLKPLKEGQSLAPSIDELSRAQAAATRNRAAPRLPVR